MLLLLVDDGGVTCNVFVAVSQQGSPGGGASPVSGGGSGRCLYRRLLPVQRGMH